MWHLWLSREGAWNFSLKEKVAVIYCIHRHGGNNAMFYRVQTFIYTSSCVTEDYSFLSLPQPYSHASLVRELYDCGYKPQHSKEKNAKGTYNVHEMSTVEYVPIIPSTV